MNDKAVGSIHEYDAELGRITDDDRANADDLCNDLGIEPDEQNVETISLWFRKIRYEAVMADRKRQAR